MNFLPNNKSGLFWKLKSSSVVMTLDSGPEVTPGGEEDSESGGVMGGVK